MRLPMSDTRIRLGYDLTAAMGQRTGVGEHSYCLARQIAATATDIDTHFFTGHGWCEDPVITDSDSRRTRHDRLAQLNRAITSLGPGVDYAKKWLSHRVQSRLLQRGLRSRHIDLFHSPSASYYPSHVPTLTTIHDIAWHRHPETHPVARIRWMEKQLHESLQHCPGLFTVSDFTKRELIEVFGADANRITVTPNGVDSRFQPMEVKALTNRLTVYGLKPDGYCLFLGNMEPRKNLARLLRAFSALPAPLRKRYPLVIAGGQGWMNADIHARLDVLRRRGEGWALGYLPRDDIPYLLSGARLFLYPSLYEGFGMPPLEAMACGTATLVSDIDVLREVTGDAAVHVAPTDTDAWREKMAELLQHDEQRTARVRSGLVQAAGFTWQKSAAIAADIYRATAATV